MFEIKFSFFTNVSTMVLKEIPKMLACSKNVIRTVVQMYVTIRFVIILVANSVWFLYLWNRAIAITINFKTCLKTTIAKEIPTLIASF